MDFGEVADLDFEFRVLFFSPVVCFFFFTSILESPSRGSDARPGCGRLLSLLDLTLHSRGSSA